MNPFEFGPPAAAREGERLIELPAALESKAALLAFLRGALPLPDYFGDNWDAFEECLADLPVGETILLVHADLPLAGWPEDQRVYLEVLAGAIDHGAPLRAWFPETSREAISALLAESEI